MNSLPSIITAPILHSIPTMGWIGLTPIDIPDEDRGFGSAHNFFDTFQTHAAFRQITNQFKLTVLPADQDLLLKHAQELLAKLDGIGARIWLPRKMGRGRWISKRTGIRQCPLRMSWC